MNDELKNKSKDELISIIHNLHKEQKNAKELAQIIIDTAQIIIITLDKSGNILTLNKFMEELSGYYLDDVRGKNWFDLFLVSDEAEKIKKIFAQAINNIQTCGNRNLIKLKNGETRLIEWYDKTLKNSSGELIGIIAFGIDVTERNDAEIKLKESEKNYKLLFDNSNDGLLILDLNGQILKVNKRKCEMLEYNETELLKKNIREIEIPSISEDVKILMFKIIKNGYAVFERKQKTKSGKTIQIEASASIVEYNGKKAIFGIDRDITERKLSERKQKELQKQLIHSEKLSAVGQLAAGIAHEFNNILAIIYNNAQLMEYEEYKNSPDLLKSIEYATKRGAGIVANMMAFAKPLTPKKEKQKIEDIIEDVLNIQKQQLILEHIEIDRNYEPTEKVLIDKGQFQQVFLNLIINARHAIQPKNQGKISVSVKTKSNNLEVKIADDGIGIDAENLKNIFNPFFTTKGALSGNNLGIKGTGLGLSVTHTIIKNHNGTIRVESEKDKGATFIIELPISEEQSENITQELEKKTEEKIESKVLNVLLVDDENSIITSMTRLFRINNCNVKNSVSGLEGLKLARENKFDVVFLDMLLPDISGENIFKEIRQFDKDVPIVFISGQIGLEVEKLKELGAYGFIQKPFSMDDVKKILTEIREKK